MHHIGSHAFSRNASHPTLTRRRFILVVVGLVLFYLICTTVFNNKPKHEQRDSGRAERGELVNASNVAIYKLSDAEFIDSTLEGQLPAAFSAILKDYSTVSQADVKIVFVVTYYRAGSSFLGELLSQGPRTFFHFEPLIPFTVSGRIRRGRERHAFQLIEHLLRCQLEAVPLYTVWLENHGYYKFNHFLANICEGGQSCSSPSHLSALCKRASTQVFKFTRLYMRQVAVWLKRNPDIARSVRVLHLVRDPRAIYSSRRGLGWCTRNIDCDKPSALCNQMRMDIEAFGELTGFLPATRMQRLRFEDLAWDAMNETQRLYARLGLDYTTSVAQYVANHTKATFEDIKDAHSTKRNTQNVPDQWKTKLSRKTIGVIEEECRDVLQSLGYELLVRGRDITKTKSLILEDRSGAGSLKKKANKASK